MGMTLAEWIVFLWILLTLIPSVFCIGRGAAKILLAAKRDNEGTTANFPMMEILVPIKGTLPDQGRILESLLRQDYPSYNVIFLVESQEDTAVPIVENLCSRFPHARKLITGTAGLCGQKNHNLVQGIKNLNSDSAIIVFCDSNNLVEPDWLSRFTEPVRTGAYEVVTTFRAFDPRPATIWGISQAIYASFLLLLIANKPTPWGGATAISRNTFNRLGVMQEWSRNVIDDLALGNILDNSGIPVFLDHRSLVRSPLPDQCLGDFVHYLDRQILFPKWTNPVIWFTTLIFHLGITAAIVATIIGGILFPFGLINPILGCASYGFLVAVFAAAMLFWTMNPFRIPVRRWLVSFLPFVFVTAFVFSRSLFRNHIEWRGRRYYPGKGGVVVCVEEANLSSDPDSTNR